jgi:hypothetical protein
LDAEDQMAGERRTICLTADTLGEPDQNPEALAKQIQAIVTSAYADRSPMSISQHVAFDHIESHESEPMY